MRQPAIIGATNVAVETFAFHDAIKVEGFADTITAAQTALLARWAKPVGL